MIDENIFLGALEDNRPEDRKQKDHHFAEAVAFASPVIWTEKQNIRKFTVRDQGQAGSCVANTVAKLEEIQYFNKTGELVPFSATSIYQYRSNKPSGGMIGVEAFDIWRKQGITTEAILRSQSVASDAEIDAIKIPSLAKDTAKVFGIDGFVQTPFDIDVIASIIENTKKGVMVWFRFTASEWSSEMPMIKGTSAPLAHSVTAVDYTIHNGKKCLVIEDSAHFGGLAVRYISEEWVNPTRMFFSAYPLNAKFITDGSMLIPKVTFTKPLVFIPLDAQGNISDLSTHNAQKGDVVLLQNILKKEGVFPINYDSTGYYGALTCKAVLAFQKKYKLGTNESLDLLGGKRVGQLTIAQLNSL
jgi:hypothetical protein